MSLISVNHLTFAYDGSYDNVFDDVSLQLDTNWKLGFTGRNGRGKTTFLKLLMASHPYQGVISSSVSFEYFPYEVPDKTRKTIEIIGEILGGYPLWELLRELSLLRVPEEALYRPFYTLSCGEQTKVLLAALFLKENSFLLIDEPTNHLDMDGRRILSDYLAAKKSFILVSHDREFLDHCIDHILILNKASIEIQSGNFSSWWINKQRQDQFETERNDKLKKEIARLEQTVREKAAWAETAETRKIGFDPDKVEKSLGRRAAEGAKSKKSMKRAKAIGQRQSSALEEKAALLKNIEDAEALKISPLQYHASKLISLYRVSVSFGEKEVLKNVTFSVDRGDRIALCGNNGSGKSSIVKLICGEPIDYKGNLTRGSQLVISYVPQDASFLTGNLAEYAAEQGIGESLFKTILRKLDFQRVQFEKDMADLSSGQKKKVLIARSLCERAHLYIWDEPLNFFDVFSRIQIEKLLTEFKPTLLFVEHDKAFCDNIATKRITL